MTAVTASPRPVTRPGAGGLVVRQTRHEVVGIARTPVALFFALAFPVGFFVVLASLIGNVTIDSRSGVRLAQFLAPAFAAFGIAMATFAFLAIGLADIRFNGVLRRLSGTPLPRWALLAGRVGAGAILALASLLLLVAVGVVFFQVQVVWRTAPAVVLTVLVAAMSFSALGLALAAWAPSMQAAVALANGIVISLAFVSDLFVVGALPSWMAAVGWTFPLKHLVNTLGDAFNPNLPGAGFAWGHLAVIVAWGVVGAVLASWGLRRAAVHADAGPAASASKHVTGSSRADARPRRHGRPGALTLVSDQARHANASQWRDWTSVFFGVAFPVLLVALLTTVFGGRGARTDDGALIGALLASALTVYGAAVIGFVNLPQELAALRTSGVLRRWQGSPLPPWALLSGRAVSAVWLSLIAMLLVYVVAVPLFDVPIAPTWPQAALVLVVSAASFAALGMAVASLVRSSQAVLAVCLGFLVTLSFFSDIFVFGVAFPRWLDVVSWVFPLRNAVHAFTDLMAPGSFDPGSPWLRLAVVGAWGLAGALIAVVRFRSTSAS